MKNLGNVKDSKDITTKEYVDGKDSELDLKKLEEKDLSELTNTEIQALWNKYMED